MYYTQDDSSLSQCSMVIRPEFSRELPTFLVPLKVEISYTPFLVLSLHSASAPSLSRPPTRLRSLVGLLGSRGVHVEGFHLCFHFMFIYIYIYEMAGDAPACGSKSWTRTSTHISKIHVYLHTSLNMSMRVCPIGRDRPPEKVLINLYNDVSLLRPCKQKPRHWKVRNSHGGMTRTPGTGVGASYLCYSD